MKQLEPPYTATLDRVDLGTLTQVFIEEEYNADMAEVDKSYLGRVGTVEEHNEDWTLGVTWVTIKFENGHSTVAVIDAITPVDLPPSLKEHLPGIKDRSDTGHTPLSTEEKAAAFEFLKIELAKIPQEHSFDALAYQSIYRGMKWVKSLNNHWIH